MAQNTVSHIRWQYVLPILAFIVAVVLSAGIAGAAAPPTSGNANREGRISPALGGNGKIAFSSARTGQNQIFVMNADGSNQVNLTNDNTVSDTWPRWSPDGTKIAFVRGILGAYEIFVMNADGSNPTRLTNNAALDDSPAWSPDGTRIAFESNRDGDFEIYVMNADGSNQLNLTHAPGSSEEQPAWSPDGTKIVFPSNRDGSTDIWRVNADGSNPTQLTTDSAAISNAQPSFSPDGTRIAYTQVNINGDVWVMNANGSNQTNVTNLANAYDGNPTWAPDGSKIIFASNRANNQTDIFTMDPNGANVTNISNYANGNDGTPSWQPTGVPTPTATPTCITSGWEVVTSQNTISTTNVLRGVAAVSPSDAWAVGESSSNTSVSALIERWSNSAWSVVPNNIPDGSRLRSVAVVNANDVWAVGGTGAMFMKPGGKGTDASTSPAGGGSSSTLIAHWNGVNWSVIPSPNPGLNYNELTGITVVSATDIWAVGQYDLAGNITHNMILHWTGGNWTQVASPNPGTVSNYLGAITAVSATDIWAVGDAYSTGDPSGVSVTLHWTGGNWTQVASPSVGTSSTYLFSVSAVSATDVWAVGDSTSNNVTSTFAIHWNGVNWTQFPTPNIGDLQNELSGVVAISAGDVWAVGHETTNNVPRSTFIVHWSGASWAQIVSPNATPYDNSLNAIARVSATELWAVGYKDQMTTVDTLVEHYPALCGGPTSTATNTVAPTLTSTGVPSTATNTAVPPTATRTVTPQPTQTQGGATATTAPSNTPAPPTSTSTAGIPSATPTNSGATATPTVCLIKFEDVGAEDWYFGYVEYLFCHQIVSGYQSVPPCVEVDRTCFKPNNTTTRGQVAKIVTKAFNFPVNTTGGPHFTDVAPGSTFYNYVETLYNLGVLGGYADGTFRPDNIVTRGQIAKVVVKGAVASDPVNWQLVSPATSTFEDVPVGSTFFDYVETAVAHSILSGYPCGIGPAGACGPAGKPYFMPASDATRAQISKIVFLAITWPVK